MNQFWQAHNRIKNSPNFVGKHVNARQIRIKPGKYNIKLFAISVFCVNIVVVNKDLIVFQASVNMWTFSPIRLKMPWTYDVAKT